MKIRLRKKIAVDVNKNEPERTDMKRFTCIRGAIYVFGGLSWLMVLIPSFVRCEVWHQRRVRMYIYLAEEHVIGSGGLYLHVSLDSKVSLPKIVWVSDVNACANVIRCFGGNRMYRGWRNRWWKIALISVKNALDNSKKHIFLLCESSQFCVIVFLACHLFYFCTEILKVKFPMVSLLLYIDIYKCTT